MADPVTYLRTLSSQPRLVQQSARMLPGAKESCLQLANRCSNVVISIEESIGELKARGLVAEANAPLMNGITRLAPVLQRCLVFVSQLQNRNIVSNLLNLQSDQNEVKQLHEELCNIEMDFKTALLPFLYDAREQARALYPVEDKLRQTRDDMEDAIDEDIRRWRQIAEERMRGLNDGRDNLAIQLQVPYNKLAEEIKKLKDGSKNAPEGPIKEFLLHALSDYRVSRTITSMAIAADVCFMVDCTGSMTTLLDYTKRIIKELLNELKKEFPHVNVRMSFVGYRDFDSSGRSSFEVVPFGAVEMVSAKMSGVQALSGYGSDWAEDVLGGLKQAISLDWNGDAHSRILFHILDAPPHGKQFRDFGPQQDRYYLDDRPDPAGVKPNDFREILTELVAMKKVDYYFFALNKTTRGTESLFAEHIKTIRSGVFDVTALYEEAQTGKAPDYTALLKKVLKSTSDSIYGSFSKMTMELPPDAY